MASLLNTARVAEDHAASDASPLCGVPKLYARVHVANRHQIEAAFGEDVAIAVLAALHDRAAALAGPASFVSWRADGLDVFVDEPAQLPSLAACDSTRAKLLLQQELTRSLSAVVGVRGLALFPLISVAVAALDSADGSAMGAAFARAQADLEAVLIDVSFAPATKAVGSQAARKYGADMATAALVARAVAEGRLYLTWQPIIGTAANAPLLYSEGLCRIVDPVCEFGAASNVALPRDFIPALERTGLVRELDAHVVSETIGRLREDSSLRLGCNISAHSAVVDGWWVDIIAGLAEEPELAHRLTIEITETAAFASLARSIDFVRAMRRMGCRIAIDDFGARRTAIRDVAALQPDIIKIDARFLRRLGSTEALPTLQPLIALAATLAVEVVIDGVEDAASDQLAHEAGGRWLQGSFIADPRMTLSHHPADATDIADPPVAILSAPSLMRLRGFALALTLSAVLWAALWAAWHCLA